MFSFNILVITLGVHIVRQTYIQKSWMKMKILNTHQKPFKVPLSLYFFFSQHTICSEKGNFQSFQNTSLMKKI